MGNKPRQGQSREPQRQPAGGRYSRSAGRSPAMVVIVAGMLCLVITLGACSDDVLTKARKAEQNGDFQTAVALYREHLAEDPENLEAVKGLAVTLYLLGDYDGALPLQEKAMALDPRDAQIRLELGFNYLNHQDDPGRAADAFAEAAALESTSKVLTFLAQAQMAAGRTTDAEVSLREAISKDDSYAHAYAVLMGLLGDQGRIAEATELKRAAEEAGVALNTEN